MLTSVTPNPGYALACGGRELDDVRDDRCDGQAEIGPAVVRVGEVDIDVPRGTPVFGQLCAQFHLLDPEQLCYVHIGTTEHGSALWLDTFWEKWHGSRSAVANSEIAEVAAWHLLLRDGGVVPTDGRVAVHHECPVDRPEQVVDGGHPHQVAIDIDTMAVTVVCIFDV